MDLNNKNYYLTREHETIKQTPNYLKKKHNKNTRSLLNNVIRKSSKMLQKQYQLPTPSLRGEYYYTVHNLIIFCIGIILAFSTHIGHLAVCLVVISMDALSVVVLQDCPLSLLEERYLNTSSTRERKDFMCSLGVGYNCDHQYEKIIELLINVLSICALKMFVIILLRSFNTTIIDYNHIYSS
jgi:hypothetical protein